MNTDLKGSVHCLTIASAAMVSLFYVAWTADASASNPAAVETPEVPPRNAAGSRPAQSTRLIGLLFRLVDRILASPWYGEHMARFWLDAARYADTFGLHEDDYQSVWPYRDWVIRAFNANMPFERFTVVKVGNVGGLVKFDWPIEFSDEGGFP